MPIQHCRTSNDFPASEETHFALKIFSLEANRSFQSPTRATATAPHSPVPALIFPCTSVPGHESSKLLNSGPKPETPNTNSSTLTPKPQTRHPQPQPKPPPTHRRDVRGGPSPRARLGSEQRSLHSQRPLLVLHSQRPLLLLLHSQRPTAFPSQRPGQGGTCMRNGHVTKHRSSPLRRSPPPITWGGPSLRPSPPLPPRSDVRLRLRGDARRRRRKRSLR